MGGPFHEFPEVIPCPWCEWDEDCEVCDGTGEICAICDRPEQECVAWKVEV